MEPEETQINNENMAQQSNMTGDETAASLGLATSLSEDILRSANPNPEGEEEDVQDEPQIEDKEELTKADVQGMISKEMGGIKDILKDYLDGDSK